VSRPGAAAPAPGTAVPVLRPGDLRELQTVVRDTPGALRLRGAGTALDRGRVPERTDAVVDLTAMGGLVEHSPGDMIAVVQPGLPLARLQAALASSGQRLALDPPSAAEGATMGGLFAADDAGPSRLRHGTLRDLAIGLTGVLADGTVFRSGGRVVKNVAGFDLVRLLCGSLGTLAAVGELVVRLHPLPEAVRTVAVPADAAAATRLTLALLAAPVEPAALEWTGDALLVRLEGRAGGVAAQARAVRALAADLPRAGAGQAGVEEAEGDGAAAWWAAVARGARGLPGETVAVASVLPSRVAEAAATAARLAAGAGVAGPAGPAAPVTAATGLGLVRLRLAGDADRVAGVVRAWRARTPGTLVLHRRPDAVAALADPWFDTPDQAPPALALMRRVKDQLDPGRRLAPGLFAGGL